MLFYECKADIFIPKTILQLSTSMSYHYIIFTLAYFNKNGFEISVTLFLSTKSRSAKFKSQLMTNCDLKLSPISSNIYTRQNRL